MEWLRRFRPSAPLLSTSKRDNVKAVKGKKAHATDDSRCMGTGGYSPYLLWYGFLFFCFAFTEGG